MTSSQQDSPQEQRRRRRRRSRRSSPAERSVQAPAERSVQAPAERSVQAPTERSEQTSVSGSAERSVSAERAKAQAEAAAARKAAVQHAPFVALSIQTSGIHPSTSRVVIIDAVTFTPDGQEVEHFHEVLSPGVNPGPFHLHGLTPEEVQAGKRFSQILKPLGQLLDDRTLIVHNTPRVWGFIVAESRRAMSNAARANRSRQRGRNRRRQRVGRVPKPALIIDTLATARRQGVDFEDTRIRALANTLGLDAPPAQANAARAAMDAATVAREDTLLIARMHFVQRATGTLAQYDPNDLRGDKFGLQRSEIRIDAIEAPRPFENPGVYSPETGLVQGMEVVVAPEISMDPDAVIEAIAVSGLAYSEKLTRKTSLVVCNKTSDLVGKAMHGQRKGIPLLSDTDFMQVVQEVAAGQPANASTKDER